jgi:homoserine dehydrogenase
MVADLDTARAKEITGGQCEVVSDGNLVVNQSLTSISSSN